MLKQKKLRDREVEKWLSALKIELEGHKPELAHHIGDHEYTELSNILFNIEQSLEVRKRHVEDREREITRNFKKYCGPHERVFAQFGYAHVFADLDKRYGHKDSFIDFLNQDDAYAGRSIVIPFMPWEGRKAYFPLLTDVEKKQITPIVLDTPFPQMVDFRNMASIQNSFDFAIIVEGTYQGNLMWTASFDCTTHYPTTQLPNYPLPTTQLPTTH